MNKCKNNDKKQWNKNYSNEQLLNTLSNVEDITGSSEIIKTGFFLK